MNLKVLLVLQNKWKSYDLDTQMVMAANLGGIFFLLSEIIKGYILEYSYIVFSALWFSIFSLSYSFLLVFFKKSINKSKWIFFITSLFIIVFGTFTSYGSEGSSFLYLFVSLLIGVLLIKNYNIVFALVTLSVILIFANDYFSIIQVPQKYASENEKIIDYAITFILISAFFVWALKIIRSRYRKENNLLKQKSKSLQKTNFLLEKERKRAINALKIKSDFLSTISHELRTPLNSIIGNLGELDITDNNKAEIRSSANSLLEMVNTVLDLNAITDGNIKISISPVKVESLLNEIIFFQKHNAQKKGIKIINKTVDISKIFIQTDKTRFKQIFNSILNNAIKFSDKGKIEIEAIIIKECEIDILKIRVSDEGIGINRKDKHKIFSPFSQSDNSIKRKYGGLGLGLAYARKLAKELKGYIKLIESSEKGSTFEFGVKANIIKPIKPLIVMTPQLKQKTILIVEDTFINFKVLETILKSTKARILHAENGDIAVTMALSNTIDFIFMDLHMPVMNGFESTDAILQNKDLPIVAYTADVTNNIQKRVEESGMVDYLSKPITRNEVFDVINRHILLDTSICSNIADVYND